MVKSSFSTKLTLIDKKTVKNHQKLTSNYIIKMRSNLTTKMGIVGVQVC